MRMLKVSFGPLKLTSDGRVVHFDYGLETALAWTKSNRSFRNGKFKSKQNFRDGRQSKEMLRIRREN